MAATINNFITAMLYASDSLKSLSDAEVLRDDHNEVVVSRTTHFAQGCIEWHQSRYMLYLPLSAEALSMARHAAVKLRLLSSQIVPHYRLLSSEMCYTDSRGEYREADLLLEQWPQGEPLDRVAATLSPEVLEGVLRELEGEFERLTLRHGNLKAENIIVGQQDGRLYPVRLHYAEVGESCKDEFAALRGELSQIVGYDIGKVGCEAATAPQEPLNALYGYHSVGNPFGGMCVAESSAGYGYITPEGEELIEPQYLWAANMREGRAEVETATGMGLIDSDGIYIIEPRYQIVEFDAATGISRAKANGQWFLFDYDGRLLE